MEIAQIPLSLSTPKKPPQLADVGLEPWPRPKPVSYSPLFRPLALIPSARLPMTVTDHTTHTVSVTSQRICHHNKQF